MSVRSGQVHVAEMTFRIFGQPIHPDWLAVRAHRRIALGDWLADVRIIEGGHAVFFASADLRVSEILAGPDLTIPDPGLLYRSGLRGEKKVRLRPSPRFEYQACVEVERLDPRIFTRLSEELALDATPGDLVRRGEPASRLEPAPLTRIHLEARRGGLSVQAFQTFPAESAIVRSQSLFELRSGKGA